MTSPAAGAPSLAAGLRRSAPDERARPRPVPARAISAGARPRIAHLVRQYAPSTGGLETYVEELARRQAGTNRVTIVTLNRLFGRSGRLPAIERHGRVVVVRVPFIGFREFFLPLLRPGLLRRFQVVHVHATDQLLDLTALLRRVTGTRYVVTTHGLFFHTERLRRIKEFYLRHVTRRGLRRAEAVFAVSGNDGSIVRGVGVEPVPLRNPVVPLGDFIAEGRDLLYLGRIAPSKRVDRLVEFARVVMARDPAIRLHVVGSDPDGHWGPIGAAVERAGLGERILYHGYLSRERLRAVLERSGYIVSASRYEGHGLSIVEGMSVGLLPVMHANAAFRETQALSGTGLLADFDDPRGAAEAFLAWRETAGPDQRRRAASYAHAQGWDAAMAALDHAYEAVLHAAR